MNNNQYELIGTSILETYRSLSRTITERDTQRRGTERRKSSTPQEEFLDALGVGRRRTKKRRKGSRREDEEMIGESVWNTYRSMAYLIEAYNRAERIRAVTQERARRAEKHRKRTGQPPRSTSRLNPEGKPQSGERRDIKRYSTNPPTP